MLRDMREIFMKQNKNKILYVKLKRHRRQRCIIKMKPWEMSDKRMKTNLLPLNTESGGQLPLFTYTNHKELYKPNKIIK